MSFVVCGIVILLSGLKCSQSKFWVDDVCIVSSDDRNSCQNDVTVNMDGHRSDVSVPVSTSLALVVYDEEKILPHEKRVRYFQYAGENIEIKQDWMGLGVAAVVWDSAVVLAEYLYQHKHLVEDKRVIELGAGTGLAGLVAAVLGGHVTVTERSEAMTHLTSTIRNNTKDKDWRIEPQVLDWTQPLHSSLTDSFDVVLGADIIYIEDTFEDLLRTVKDLAVRRETLVLLSCRIRYDRDRNFLNMLEKYFDVNEDFLDEEKKIKIFSARRTF